VKSPTIALPIEHLARFAFLSRQSHHVYDVRWPILHTKWLPVLWRFRFRADALLRYSREVCEWKRRKPWISNTVSAAPRQS